MMMMTTVKLIMSLNPFVTACKYVIHAGISCILLQAQDFREWHLQPQNTRWLISDPSCCNHRVLLQPQNTRWLIHMASCCNHILLTLSLPICLEEVCKGWIDRRITIGYPRISLPMAWPFWIPI